MRRGLLAGAFWAFVAYLMWRLAIKPLFADKARIPTVEEIEETAKRFRERLENDERFRAVLDHPLTQNWFPKRS